MPLSMMFALIVWYCCDYEFAMDASTWPFSLILSISQNKLIYSCFLAKKSLITVMMHELQHLISQSMFLHV